MAQSDRSERSRVYFDAHGQETDDPTHAVSGELAEHAHGRLRRTRFFLQRSELPWLPVGEAAFLLWVLAALLVIWASIGLILRFA
ncbi:MAG: hypothetical protein ACJ74D_14050 [Gaiellaceae bacterium]